MSAPKGNRFWEVRSSHGRAPKFETAEQLWQACVEYFEWVESNPLWASKTVNHQGTPIDLPEAKMRAMTIDGLCIFLDITDQTLYNYKERGNDFLEVINKADRVIRYQKFTGAAADLLNPNIIARDLGLADKKEHTGANGGAITIAELSDEQLAAIIASSSSR